MATPRPLPGIGDWLRRSFARLGRRWSPLVLLGLSGAAAAGLGVLLVYACAGAMLWTFADREALLRATLAAVAWSTWSPRSD